MPVACLNRPPPDPPPEPADPGSIDTAQAALTPGAFDPEEVHSGKPGPQGDLPPVKLHLRVPDPQGVSCCLSGPDGGIDSMRACAPDFQMRWDKPTTYAYGHSISMYDCSASGARNGEPIADCFGIISYEGGAGALLAVADGVNWGEPARRAARCAILGSLQHLHGALRDLAGAGAGAVADKKVDSTEVVKVAHENGAEAGAEDVTVACLPAAAGAPPTTDSHWVFEQMIAAVHAGQRLIIQQMGTLTTLVLVVVLPLTPACAAAVAAGPPAAGTVVPSAEDGASPPPPPPPAQKRWAALTLTVGDSAAWAWRLDREVPRLQELTQASHAGEFRDARFVPGVLGYAMGDDPDLANMTTSLTVLQPGDMVLLASDGIADNYDPVLLQLARAAPPPSEVASMQDPTLPPPLTPDQIQAQHEQLLGSALSRAAAGTVDPDLSAVPIGPPTAQVIVEGLLSITYHATEPLRQATAERARADSNGGARGAGRSLFARDLGTDRGSRGALRRMPPGKLDHATVVAFQVLEKPPAA